jgi:hypothetical protein
MLVMPNMLILIDDELEMDSLTSISKYFIGVTQNGDDEVK